MTQRRRIAQTEYSDVAAVMLPLPAQGHLNQLLHLSRLLSSHNIPVFFAAAAAHLRQAQQRVHGWQHDAVSTVQFHELPSIPFRNPNPNPNPISPNRFPNQIVPSLLTSINLRRPVNDFISSVSTDFRRVIVVFDTLMSYVVQDLDSIENVEMYVFRSMSAFTTCSWGIDSLPNLPIEAEIVKQAPPMNGYFDHEFGEFLKLQEESRKNFSGEIFNSNEVIEGLYLNLLRKDGSVKIFPLGPFNPQIRDFNFINPNCKTLNWLDNHPPNSVIYVSFGTTASFSDAQIAEIALGLERSHQKFIWVLRDADKGDIFSGDVREIKLPDGFEPRISERGLVIRDWAPQLGILSHSSTGGFLSHCGWNSCLESFSNGVPMVTWPLHSDQPGNSVLVSRVLKVGIEVKPWSRRNEVVTALMVETAVRRVMETAEGDEMRKRAVELGNAVRDSVSEGGDGRKMMEGFVAHITR